MISAQDIREKTFEKSTFGGYAMSEVDDFLDARETKLLVYLAVEMVTVVRGLQMINHTQWGFHQNKEGYTLVEGIAVHGVELSYLTHGQFV